MGFPLAAGGEPDRAGSGRFREVGLGTLEILGSSTFELLKLGCPRRARPCARHGREAREPSTRVDLGSAFPLPRLGFVLKPRGGKAGPLARPVESRGKRDQRGARGRGRPLDGMLRPPLVGVCLL